MWELLTLWQIINTEKFTDNDMKKYGGWWFCSVKIRYFFYVYRIKKFNADICIV